MSNVELLIEKFSIHSYDGAEQDDQKIEYALRASEEFHSSKKGGNFTLSLKCESPFKLSHFAIGCQIKNSSQLKTGVLVVSEKPLKKDRLKDFKGSYANALKQMAKSDLKQAFVFQTNKGDGYELEIELLEDGHRSWFTGNYITLKFLDAWDDNTHIDIGTIAPIGTLDLHMAEERIGPVAHLFQAKRAPLVLLNALTRYYYDFVYATPCLMYYTSEIYPWMLELAESYRDTLPAFQMMPDNDVTEDLSIYFLGEKVSDTFAISYLSEDGSNEGFFHPTPLSQLTLDKATKFVHVIQNNTDKVLEVRYLYYDFVALEQILKKKEALTPLQQKYIHTKQALERLKANMFDDIESIPAQLDSLRLEYNSLVATLDEYELIENGLK